MIVGQGVYRDGKRLDVDGSFLDLVNTCRTGDEFVWLGLFEPSLEELDRAAEAFGIHPLAIEDAEANHERPKVDVFGDTLTVVLRPAQYVEESESVDYGQITMMCSPRHILVVRHGEAVPLRFLRQRMEARPERLSHGPGAVMHEILDTVVEAYYPVTTEIAKDIDEVELQVFSDDRQVDPTERIYRLQRQVLAFSRAVTPLVDVLSELKTIEHPVLNQELQRYVADTSDDLRRVMDFIQVDRELLHSALEANLTQVGLRQNEDMRKMSAWVAILAVPTMVAGIYGMNFKHMPELDTEFGYFIVMGGIVSICLFLFTKFKKSGWL